MILCDKTAQQFLKNKGTEGIYRFTTIEDSAAETLARFSGYLLLSGLKSLSDKAAQSLAQHAGDLNLAGLTRLSDAAAQALAQCSGILCLNGLKTLRDSPGHIALARQLAQGASGYLDLSGLRSVSDAILQELAQYNGFSFRADSTIKKKVLAFRKTWVQAKIRAGDLKEPEEWLNGRILFPSPPRNPMRGRYCKRRKASEASWWLPPRISDWFLRKLDDEHKTAAHKIGFCISPDAAELLRDKSVEWLWLADQESVVGPQAAVKSGVSLDGIKKLIKSKNHGSFPLAVEMVRTMDLNDERTWLSLLVKTRIRDLAKVAGNSNISLLLEIAGLGPAIGQLVLNNVNFVQLAELSAPAARTLVAHRKSIPLYIEHLSDAAAEVFAQYEGNLWLSGLASLSDAAARALAQHRGNLDLGGLTSLSDAAAQALAQHDGNLDLSGLSSLSDAAARTLAGHKGKLDLSGLTSLSDAAAQALAQYNRILWLNGLETLSDESAKALASHKGILWLSGLRSVSDTVALALAQHEGKLFLRGLESLSKSAAEALAQAEVDTYNSLILAKKNRK